jgi:pimeloyl-ACP methyl ester carboxylesterase
MGYSPREMAVDVLAFMDALGLQRARIVGHSMGSVVAQHAAAMAPARVERLVLIGSSANAANPGMKEFKGAVYAEGNPVSEQFARDFQVSTIHKPIPPAFLEEAIDISRLLPQHAWRGVIDGLAGDEAAAPLAGITSPTLIIWGTEDAVFSRGEQGALAAGIRGSTLEIFDGIGHAVHWEDPSGVVRRIATFLQSDVSAR